MKPGAAQIVFREAVRDLAYAPTPENVRRYLAASRVLETGRTQDTHVRNLPRAA